MSKYAGKKVNSNEYNGVRSNLGYASKNHVDNMWNELTFYRSYDYKYEDNERLLFVDGVKYVRADSIENAPRGPVVAAYEGYALKSGQYANLHATIGNEAYVTVNVSSVELLWAEVNHYRSQIEHANDPYEGSTVDEVFVQCNKAIEDLNDIVNELKARKAEDAGMIQAIREFNGNIEQRVSAAHQDLSVAAERIANLEGIVNGLVARSENAADRIEKIESNTQAINQTGDLTVTHVGNNFEDAREALERELIKDGMVFSTSVGEFRLHSTSVNDVFIRVSNRTNEVFSKVFPYHEVVDNIRNGAWVPVK